MGKNKNRKGAGLASKDSHIRTNSKFGFKIFSEHKYSAFSLILIVAGFIIYSNTLNVPFYFDDYDSIIDNPAIKNLNSFFHYNGIYDLMHTRFFSYLTFALNFHFSGLNVTGYHITNILIHLCSSLFVLLLVKEILNSSAIKDEFTGKEKFFIAALSASIFLFHPVQTQAVTYLVQRMSSLAALFYIASIYFYLRGRNLYNAESSNSVKIKSLFHFILAVISFFLSLFSKEIAATIPLAIILTELLFIRNRKGKINWYIISSISAVLIAAAVTIFSLGALPIEADNTPRQVYLFTQIDVMFTYFRLLFFPFSQNIDYDFPLQSSLLNAALMIKLLLLLALIIFAVLQYKKNKLITFGIFWFFITISVESSIIPIRDVINEHRLYLPMPGFSLIISFLLVVLSRRLGNLKIAQLFSTVLIAVLVILTFNRNELWKDPGQMWSDVISKSPFKARPYLARGSFYLRDNQPDPAISDFLKVIELDKKEFRAYDNIGYAYQSKNLYGEAIKYHDIAIKMNPSSALSFNNRGVCLLYLGEWDKAVPDFEKAASLNSNYTDAFFNLGYVFYLKKEYDKSNRYFSRALSINPAYTDIYPYLVMGNYRLGKAVEAKKYYEEMKRLGLTITKSIRDAMRD